MAHPNSFVIRGEHISKKVRSGDSELTILQDVSLTLARGERVGILGASGSGKTTLLTLLGGLDLPTSGDIYIDDAQINLMTEEERAIMRGKNIGFIFQSFQLLPSLTALENVMLPLEIQYIAQKSAKHAALRALAEVGLSKRTHHYPSQLSGGEQQRVAIARAFVTQPKIVLADEMTGNLDAETGQLVMDVMLELNEQQQTTLVLVTHDERLAAHCTRCYTLKDGTLSPC